MNEDIEYGEHGTLTLSKLILWCVVSLTLWATLIHGAIKIWEIVS